LNNKLPGKQEVVGLLEHRSENILNSDRCYLCSSVAKLRGAALFACIHCSEISNQEILTDFAYNFSPLVEQASSHAVVIDVSGCELLFGSAYQLANQIAGQAKKSKLEGGLEAKVNVALAENPDAAIHAARFLKGITFVAAGEELTCLGEFPLASLDFSLAGVEEKRAEEIFGILKLWGVQNFRDFADLPLEGISQRLGAEGIRLQKLAQGKTERHLRLKQSSPVFASSIELEHAIVELEPLSFILARLLNQICASLNSYALATNELLVKMHLEDQSVHERKLVLPYPMRDHKVLLKLLLLDIEMHPPQAAVMKVSIDCEAVKPRVLQNGLFIPLAPAPDKLELTLARLSKLVGEQNIGSPVLLDTNRPDAFSIKRFVLKTKEHRKRSSNRKSELGNRQCLGFRMFRPPLRAIVEVTNGLPKQVSAWGTQRSVYGKVINLAGPWRNTGDWWRNDCWARDEWDVAIESNRNEQAAYRIYRELNNGNWFIEGNYD
jgi:protein ImuB